MSTPGHIVRGILTLGLAQPVAWLTGLLVTMLLPRYLGDANLGKYAFALALTQLLGLIGDLGTGTYLTKHVARDPSQAPSLLAAALVLRLPLALVAIVSSIVVVNFAPYDALTREVVYVLCVAIVLNALSSVLLGVLQGLQQIKAFALNSLVGKVAFAATAAIALVGGGGPVELALAWTVSQLLAVLVSAWLLLRKIRLGWPTGWGLSKTVLVGGLPFFLWSAALQIYGQIDSVMLSFLTQDVVVGWYVAAYRLVAIPVFAPVIVITVLFPSLSAAVGEVARFNAIARKAVHIVVVLSLPMVVGIMLLPDKLLALLGYPESFSHSILPIVFLAPHIVLVSADMMIGTVLNTRDKQRQWALTGVAAAILNPLVNLIAIPYTQTAFGNGAIGAAVVTTLTEVFMLVVGVFLLPTGILSRSTLAGILRCVIPGTGMAAVVWWGRDLPLAALVPLSAGLYVTGCLAVGVLSISELKQVRLYLVRPKASSAAPI